MLIASVTTSSFRLVLRPMSTRTSERPVKLMIEHNVEHVIARTREVKGIDRLF